MDLQGLEADNCVAVIYKVIVMKHSESTMSTSPSARATTFLFILSLSLLETCTHTQNIHVSSLDLHFVLNPQTPQPPMSLSPALPWSARLPQDQSPWTSLVSGHIWSVQRELMMSLEKRALCPLSQQKETRWAPEMRGLRPVHTSLLSGTQYWPSLRQPTSASDWRGCTRTRWIRLLVSGLLQIFPCTWEQNYYPCKKMEMRTSMMYASGIVILTTI